MSVASQRLKSWIAKNPERWRAIEQRSYKKRRVILRQRQAAWRKKYPGYYRNKMLDRKARDPVEYAKEARRIALKVTYGITHEDYLKMFRAQRGRCAICRSEDTGRTKHFCIDHDHKTKKIRGLLCQRCNRALGLLGDTLKAVRAAASYMESAYAKAS